MASPADVVVGGHLIRFARSPSEMVEEFWVTSVDMGRWVVVVVVVVRGGADPWTMTAAAAAAAAAVPSIGGEEEAAVPGWEGSPLALGPVDGTVLPTPVPMPENIRPNSDLIPGSPAGPLT